jgi:predicted transcriptional regulator
MAESTTMTVRLTPELKDRLDKLAAATHRSRSYLAAEAVREYLELNEWQIREIESAIDEADAEDYAPPEDVAGVLKKWGMNGS